MSGRRAAAAIEAARRREAEAAEQEAAAAKRKADFRDGIFAALRAAEEPDPFASIRGDFDLSPFDSRQWKTSLQLVGADKCALLKTPPAQRSSASDAGVSGRTMMTVQNSTTYELTVFFDGPVSKKLTMPGASQDVDLAPGTFHVAGRVAAANVLPFYGEETYAGSASYSLRFYIGQ